MENNLSISTTKLFNFQAFTWEKNAIFFIQNIICLHIPKEIFFNDPKSIKALS